MNDLQEPTDDRALESCAINPEHNSRETIFATGILAPHCFHRSETQHAIHVPNGSHDCLICCHCGRRKCITTTRPVTGTHGRFAP